MRSIIELECFRGPLEVLLSLVQSEELSLTRIRLVEILDQVMDDLEFLNDLNESGDVLIVLSTLLELKSKLMLPGEVNLQQEIEALKEDLLEKLLIHRRLAEVLDSLEFRARRREGMHTRPGSVNDKEEVLIPLENQNPEILKILAEALKETARTDSFRVDYELPPIDHYFQWVRREYAGRSMGLFEMVRRHRDLLDVMGLLIALLEMVRQRELWMEASELGNDILFSWRSDKADDAVHEADVADLPSVQE